MLSNVCLAEKNLLPTSWDADAYIENQFGETYVKRMLSDLSCTLAEKMQQTAHCTFGQVVATMRMEFGFHVGTPSIHSVWPRGDALPEWVARTQLLCARGSEDAALKEIALTTSRLKAGGRLAQLSANLKYFDLKNLPDVVLVSLLRNTFSIRSHISFWNSLLDQTEQILQARGREPRKLLRGLKNWA